MARHHNYHWDPPELGRAYAPDMDITPDMNVPCSAHLLRCICLCGMFGLTSVILAVPYNFHQGDPEMIPVPHISSLEAL